MNLHNVIMYHIVALLYDVVAMQYQPDSGSTAQINILQIQNLIIMHNAIEVFIGMLRKRTELTDSK